MGGENNGFSLCFGLCECGLQCCYPTRIERIFIRNITGGKRDDARFAPVFAGIEPDRWILFVDPDELPRMLRQP